MPAGVANAIGIVNANRLLGITNVEATLGEIEYESRSPKMCMASITARYVWQVRKNFNGTIKAVSIAGQKKFACVKTGETWRCS